MTTAYSTKETGVLVHVAPGVATQGSLVLELQLEQSRLQPSGDAENDADMLPPAPTGELTLQTTVRVPVGQTVMIAGAQKAPAQGQEYQTYVLLRVTVQE